MAWDILYIVSLCFFFFQIGAVICGFYLIGEGINLLRTLGKK